MGSTNPLIDKSGLRQRVAATGPVETDTSAVTKTLKSIDIFNKYEDSVVQSKSNNRGVLSIFTTVLVMFLLLKEIDYYFFSRHEEYNYTVDKSKTDGHVVLNFDLIVKTPCDQVGAGVSDDAGADIRTLSDISEQPAYFEMDETEDKRYGLLEEAHQKLEDDDIVFLRAKDIPGVLKPPSLEAPAEEEKAKQTALEVPGGANPRMNPMAQALGMPMPGAGMQGNPFGDIFGMMMMAQQLMLNPLAQAAKAPYNKGEGKPDSCRFYGSTTLNKVKGNLHIVHGKKISLGGGGFAHLTMISSNQRPYNFTHRVNQLSFSTIDEQGTYTIQALDGHTSQGGGKSNYLQYFLNVVGINFVDEGKKYYNYA